MVSMMAGGLFNALAFVGAGYLFKKFDKNGSEEEMKRHNLAMEELAKAKEEWSENEIMKKNKIQQMRAELSDANANISETNKALDLLRTVIYRERTFKKEPKLHDYYTPSPEMQQYQLISEGILGVGAGWAGYKIYKYARERIHG